MPEVDLKSSTIDKALDLLKSFLERAFGPSVDEFGLMLQDNMKARRERNQLNIFAKAKAKADKDNVDVKQIDFKALYPLLEGISLEEDETLQDMWANLFVNYVDSTKNLTTHVYPAILKQLSSEEVEIIKQMEGNDSKIRILTRALMGKPDFTFAYVDQITNLERLGIIIGIPVFRNVTEQKDGYSIANHREKVKSSNIKQLSPSSYVITDFGKQFLNACKR